MSSRGGDDSKVSEVANPNNGDEVGINRAMGLGDILRLVLPIVSLFSVLAYVMGRLYIRSYYSEFGLLVSALDFTAEDYMFFSFDIVVMSLTAAYFTVVYWYTVRRDESAPYQPQSLRMLIPNSFEIMPVLGILALLVIIVGVTGSASGLGFMGFFTGALLGILFNAYDWVMRTWSQIRRSARFSRYVLTLKLIFIAFVVFGLLPIAAERMAVEQVGLDREKLPQVAITSQEDLPLTLRSGPDNPKESLKMGLIAINNGMAYFVKPADASAEQMTAEQEVYAIPSNTIRQIIYFRSLK